MDMNTTAFANRMFIFTGFRGKLSLLGVALGLASLGLGCNEGEEGDYCNPELSHNECNSGLACTAASMGKATTAPYVFTDPLTWAPNAPCAENYCCPIKGGSDNPRCQPGCNGSAALICAADPDASYACEFAKENPQDGGS
jgi:hypothetical protein